MTLRVFNLLGQEVLTLLDEDKTAGTYSVQWGGRNAAGEAVAGGVYLYRLQVNGSSEIRKMTLIR